jgi:hypothetical protein
MFNKAFSARYDTFFKVVETINIYNGRIVSQVAQNQPVSPHAVDWTVQIYNLHSEIFSV